MIKRAFYIKDMELKYYVGINQIKFDVRQFSEDKNIKNQEKALKYLFNILERVQEKYKDSTVQFIKEKYLLNEDHIYVASYYVEKAFCNKTHISKKKNIELLLYLSTQRQISRAIESFGISYSDLEEATLTICSISPRNNIHKINQEILHLLKAHEIEITINNLTNEKINRITDYFEISENQVKSVLNSYTEKNTSESEKGLSSLSLAVFDLISEKMALLNLE